MAGARFCPLQERGVTRPPLPLQGARQRLGESIDALLYGLVLPGMRALWGQGPSARHTGLPREAGGLGVGLSRGAAAPALGYSGVGPGGTVRPREAESRSPGTHSPWL